MDNPQYELFSKVHNELISRMGIEADHYERQDSFSAIIDVMNGKDMKEALIEAFDAVYDVEVTDEIYESCYNLCKGFKEKDDEKKKIL